MESSSSGNLVMDLKLEEAAEDGDTSFLEKARLKDIEDGGGEYFLRQNSRKENILHISIRWGSISTRYGFVKEVLERFPREIIEKLINQGDNDGYTPLHVATDRGSRHDILKLFLKYDKFTKEAWRVHNSDGNTPLHLAVIHCDNTEAVELLVKQHPDLLAYDRNNKNGNTSHHFAAAKGRVDILKLLLEHDEHGKKQEDKVAKPAWRVENADGNTPLHVALIEGKVEVVKFMLEEDPDLLAYGGKNNKDGNTPLHLAAAMGEISIIKQILEYEHKQQEFKEAKLAWEMQNADGNTPLYVALIKGHTELARLLVEQHPGLACVTNNLMQNADGNTPLHVALIKGHTEFARLLVEQHPDLACVTNNLKEIPLHLAIKHYLVGVAMDFEKVKTITVSESQLAESINNKITMIELLVEKESCVACWHDIEGLTPLHRAAFLITGWSLRVIRFIIERCPESAKEVDTHGKKTILHFMITNRISSYKKGRELLRIPEIDGLRNCKDQQGNTPLDLAWKTNIKMVRALIDSSTQQNTEGASITCFIRHMNEFQIVEKRKRIMEKYGVIDDMTDIGLLKRKLCKFGMNFLYSRDSIGRNVLHYLMQIEKASPIKYEEFVDFIKQVVDCYPILVRQIDNNGDTPLHILVRNYRERDRYITVQLSLGKSKHEVLSESQLWVELVRLCCKYFQIAKEEAISSTKGGDCYFKYNPPWLVQNVEGNTLLHEAFKGKTEINTRINVRHTLLGKLLEVDIKTVTGLRNKRKEAPLHIAAEATSFGKTFEGYSCIERLSKCVWYFNK